MEEDDHMRSRRRRARSHRMPRAGNRRDRLQRAASIAEARPRTKAHRSERLRKLKANKDALLAPARERAAAAKKLMSKHRYKQIGQIKAMRDRRRDRNKRKDKNIGSSLHYDVLAASRIKGKGRAAMTLRRKAIQKALPRHTKYRPKPHGFFSRARSRVRGWSDAMQNFHLFGKKPQRRPSTRFRKNVGAAARVRRQNTSGHASLMQARSRRGRNKKSHSERLNRLLELGLE